MKSGEFQSSGVIQSLFEDTYDNFFQSQDGHMKASHGHLRHPEKTLMSDDFPVATLNALAPGKYGSNFKSTIFKLIIEHCILGIHCEITLQALTTPGNIRLPIGQPAGKYQVAPI